jgi:hypothetical protein
MIEKGPSNNRMNRIDRMNRIADLSGRSRLCKRWLFEEDRQ